MATEPERLTGFENCATVWPMSFIFFVRFRMSIWDDGALDDTRFLGWATRINDAVDADGRMASLASNPGGFRFLGGHLARQVD